MSKAYKKNKKLVDEIIKIVLESKDDEGLNSIAFCKRVAVDKITREYLLKIDTTNIDKIEIEDAVWYKIREERLMKRGDDERRENCSM